MRYECGLPCTDPDVCPERRRTSVRATSGAHPVINNGNGVLITVRLVSELGDVLLAPTGGQPYGNHPILAF